MEGTTKRARKGTEKRRRITEGVEKTRIVVFVDVDQGIAFAYVL